VEVAQIRAAREVWKWMKRFEGPQILAGDLNCEPSSKTYKFLTGKIELEDGLRGDLIDAFETVSIGDNIEITNTFLSWKPSKRIDFFLFRNVKHNLSVSHPHVLDEPSCLDPSLECTEESAASDHRAISIRLERRKGA